MSIHAFKLRRFVFPRPAKETDFRIRFDFRYKRDGVVAETTIIMPRKESWDGSRLEKDDGNSLRELDLSRVSEWESSFRIAAEEFYRARAVVYDVRTPGMWSKIASAASKGAAGAIPVAGDAIAVAIESFIAKDEDVEKLAEYPLRWSEREEEGRSKTVWWSEGGGGYYIELDYDATGT